MMKKQRKNILLIGLLLLFSFPSFAGTYAQALGKCFSKKTSEQERT